MLRGQGHGDFGRRFSVLNLDEPSLKRLKDEAELLPLCLRRRPLRFNLASKLYMNMTFTSFLDNRDHSADHAVEMTLQL